MSTFRGRAPSGLITRETGNYAWVGENGEIIVDGSHCLSDNGENLLADTDYLLMTDYPISADKLAEVKTYRQALRDIPEQAGFPRTITWPDKP